MSAVTETLVQVDTTSPEITVSGIIEGGEYRLGFEPEAVIIVIDSTSGVAGLISTVTGGNDLGLGDFILVVEAWDEAGNHAFKSLGFVVVPSIESLQLLVDDFTAAGEIDARYAKSLQRVLSGALGAPSPTAQEAKLRDFIGKVEAQWVAR